MVAFGLSVICGTALAACSSSTSTPSAAASTTTTSSPDNSTAAPAGLVAYVDSRGIEVADPQTGDARLVVPISSLEIGNSSGRRYLINGPVWAPTPSAAHPVLYFVMHDLQRQGGAADVFMRADPFAGTLALVAALPDDTGSTSGLVAVPGALAFTFGCCEDLTVEVVPFNGSAARVLSPAGSGFWESLGGALGGQVAVVHQTDQNRSYVWLDTSNGATRPLVVPPSLPQGALLGTVAVDGSGHLEALTAGSQSTGSASVAGNVDVIDLASGALRVSHPAAGLGDSLAFSPDSAAVAFSSNGALQLVATDPTAGASTYRLPAANSDVVSLTWSAPINADGFGNLRSVTPGVAGLIDQGETVAASSTTTTSSTTTSSTSTTVSSTTTTGPNPPPVTTTPELFVETGANPGTLYPEPHFPDGIVVDNHDYISGLKWTGVGAPSSTADGTYNVDDCQPNCASGHYHPYPIQLTASQPRHCVVRVYDNSTRRYRSIPAFAYNSLVAVVTGGDPNLTPQFAPACG